MKQGLLIVLSGPSGVGKGTIYSRLLERIPDLIVSVSATTRKARNGEIEGKHYYFVNNERFDSMVAAGELLEWTETVGNRYGTPRAPVLAELSKGNDVLLEIDVKGAVQIKRAYPECVTVFVLPPSEEELKRRLVGRGTESADQIADRLALAKKEIAEHEIFDHSIVNADIDKAVDDVIKIIEKEKRSKNIC